MKRAFINSWQWVVVVMLCLSNVAMADTIVGWDGTSTDITDLTGNVNVSGTFWEAADGIWNTTDLTFAAIGSQAACKVAYSQIQQTHRTAQINAGVNAMFLGGGGEVSDGKTDVTEGFSTLHAFDTSNFAVSDLLTNMSVTVHERTTTDAWSFRWFVVSGGTPYVSASASANVGSTLTAYTLADPASETWYAFDGSVNLESAVGASVGTLTLTDVTHAGIMATLDMITAESNWRGLYIDKFSAETVSTIVQTDATYIDISGAAAATSADDLANQGEATYAGFTVSDNRGGDGALDDGFNDGVTSNELVSFKC